ncbi:MAG: biotin--[acetyl-CoA-carboxylase] ligase [Tannerellaceae bacterium]|jgi:BirA family biotin operon repressor/biotin-[acetyl-CoA-carboxylase] ligase|nr:biotin--[acetyl-CoA-carboxylase] ligase [Tannerellaceae bacterium]
MELRHFETLDSTNAYLRQLLLEERLPDETVVLADYQTAGRGQSGTVWESEASLNLTFSFLIYHIPPFPAKNHFFLSQIVSLCLKSALEEQLPSDIPSQFSIKWPNDIYWGDSKIAGVLIENDITEAEFYHSIIGIGVNVNQRHFTGEAPNPISLCQITGIEHDRILFLNRFMEHFRNYRLDIKEYRTKTVRDLYHAALYRRGCPGSFCDAGGTFTASVESVLPDGRLRLRTPAGIVRSYAFKEIRFILPSDPAV